MQTFVQWLIDRADHLDENTNSTRYSIEMNYRSALEEVLTHYAKICLGYVSAGLKKLDFHVKQCFDDDLIRILVSVRNWDDGTWTVIVSWNPHHKCFFLTKGFYNKSNKTVSRHGEPVKCTEDSPSKIVDLIRNELHRLKDEKDRHLEPTKRVPLKRGPKS